MTATRTSDRAIHNCRRRLPRCTRGTGHHRVLAELATCSLDGPDPTLGRSPFVSIRLDCVAVVPRVALGFSALKAFIVVNRQTRKILAEFETREEAEAFRDGLISARATGKSPLSIRSTLGDGNDQEAGAARRTEKRGRTGHPLRGKRRRGPRRPGS